MFGQDPVAGYKSLESSINRGIDNQLRRLQEEASIRAREMMSRPADFPEDAFALLKSHVQRKEQVLERHRESQLENATILFYMALYGVVAEFPVTGYSLDGSPLLDEDGNPYTHWRKAKVSVDWTSGSVRVY